MQAGTPAASQASNLCLQNPPRRPASTPVPRPQVLPEPAPSRFPRIASHLLLPTSRPESSPPHPPPASRLALHPYRERVWGAGGDAAARAPCCALLCRPAESALGGFGFSNLYFNITKF
jgi:hypothetical protein